MFKSKMIKIHVFLALMLHVNLFAMNYGETTIIRSNDLNRFRPVDCIASSILQIDSETIMSDLFINAFWNVHSRVQILRIIVQDIDQNSAAELGQKLSTVVSSFPNLKSVEIHSNSPLVRDLGQAIKERYRFLSISYESHSENPIGMPRIAANENRNFCFPPQYGQMSYVPHPVLPSTRPPKKRPREAVKGSVVSQKKKQNITKKPKLLEKPICPPSPIIVSDADRAVIDEVFMIYRQIDAQIQQKLELLEKKIDEVNKRINEGKLETPDYDAHIMEEYRLSREYESLSNNLLTFSKSEQ